MNSLAMWSAVVGFFLPMAAQYVVRISSNRSVQSLVGLVCCAVAAAVTAALTPHSGSLNVDMLTKAFAVTFVSAMSSYEHLWKPTGVAPSPGSVPPANTGSVAPGTGQ